MIQILVIIIAIKTQLTLFEQIPNSWSSLLSSIINIRSRTHTMETNSDYYNSLRPYCRHFEFLKIVGIFPFKINIDPKTQRLREISFHGSGTFFYINRLVLTLFLFYCTITYVILARHFLINGNGNSELDVVPHISWMLTLTFMAFILVELNIKKSKICGFMNEWILVQDCFQRGKGLSCQF